METCETTYWEPAFIIRNVLDWNGDFPDILAKSTPKYAAIVINQPIEDQYVLKTILAGGILTTLIVFADGAANHVNDLKLTESEEQGLIPNFICGDLDSIRPEVKAYYEKKGTKIIQNPDQYSSDLTKSLKCINNDPKFPLHVVIIGGIGGRFDQGFSQLHHLYTATPLGPGLFAENVGIIPIARPSVITTKGLEWDVTDWYTEFGGQMSTSNHIKSDTIEIDTSERVLFTMELDQSRAE
ncbi:MAG: hypothetical protein Q9205_005191 [Flavoplaca limonia]